MMGSSTANTISITAPPIMTISSGSKIVARFSAVFELEYAAFN